jgi:hypothetical protein
VASPNTEISDQVDALIEALNDRGASVGDVVPAGKTATGSIMSPDNMITNNSKLHSVWADGRNRLWRFSWTDGGSYTLIFDPGI